MKLSTLLIGFLIVLCNLQLEAQASKNVHQLIALGDDEKELRTLNLHVHGDDVEVIKIRGTRVQAKTRVSISFDNLPFLNYLMDNGRYELESIPSGGESSINIEAKFNNDIVIRGEHCSETISYVFYVPEYIENVQIHNLDSGFDTNTNTDSDEEIDYDYQVESDSDEEIDYDYQVESD
ncbi:MAG: hypothetical protein GY810_03680 [Aureispira sp.]|nr:hypothetical protein [Aureispira sp.]